MRDRPTVDEAAPFGAQPAMLIRAFHYDGWGPAAVAVRARSKTPFVDRLDEAAPFGARPAMLIRGFYDEG